MSAPCLAEGLLARLHYLGVWLWLDDLIHNAGGWNDWLLVGHLSLHVICHDSAMWSKFSYMEPRSQENKIVAERPSVTWAQN